MKTFELGKLEEELSWRQRAVREIDDRLAQ